MLDRVSNLIKDEDVFGLARTVQAVQDNIEQRQFGSAVGQCKNLLEGLSKKILERKSVPYEADIKFPKLVKITVKTLDIGGVGINDQATKEAFLLLATSISFTIEQSAEALATLRNKYDENPHAKGDGFIDIPLEYASLPIQQTDIIASFLLNICRRHDEFQPPTRFSEHEDYNNYLNDTFGQLEIFGDLYPAPDVLFALHPTKYKDELKSFQEGRYTTDDE